MGRCFYSIGRIKHHITCMEQFINTLREFTYNYRSLCQHPDKVAPEKNLRETQGAALMYSVKSQSV